MSNDQPLSGRELSAALLQLQDERELADKDLLAAIERGDQAETRRLRTIVSGLMRDIAALRFDIAMEQASREAPKLPTGGGPGWMGMMESTPRKQ